MLQSRLEQVLQATQVRFRLAVVFLRCTYTTLLVVTNDSVTTKVSRERMRAKDAIETLARGIKYDPHRLGNEVIPKSTGLYAWFTRDDKEIVYIGVAQGKNGLHQRIIKQHLNPKYLETRESKFTEKDQYQLEHPVIVKGRKAIDKSAFRKNVARNNSLSPGQESVDFIRNSFLLSFIVFRDGNKADLQKLEEAVIKIKEPKYNVSRNPAIEIG